MVSTYPTMPPVWPSAVPVVPATPMPTDPGWLALDLETAEGRPEDAERWARMIWSPSPKWKPETIGQKYLEAVTKKGERLALLDTSPVICVGLRTETELRCIHSMRAEAPRMMSGALVEGHADERAMLIALRSYLEAINAADRTLVGHNVRNFDLRRLRMAYLRAGIRPPMCLVARDVDTFDTMLEWGRRFSLDDNAFVALADILEVLGMENHKAAMTGEQTPDLFRAGAFDTIIAYCVLDVLAESDVFLRMTGQAGGLA